MRTLYTEKTSFTLIETRRDEDDRLRSLTGRWIVKRAPDALQEEAKLREDVVLINFRLDKCILNI